MNENKKFSISNMMLAFITVLVVIGLVALAGFFLLTPPDDIITVSYTHLTLPTKA